MPAQPRGRACQNCQSIKIKCELGAHGGEPPCERCTRLNKSCVLALPKRQKDKVAELEAKVAALTKLLGSQGLEDASDEARHLRTPSTQSSGLSDGAHDSSFRKKRKLEQPAGRTDSESNGVYSSPEGGTSTDVDVPDGTDWLDRMISIDQQQLVLNEYVNSYQSIFPAIPLESGVKVRVMRETVPHTFHAIIYIASAGILSWDLQDKINLTLIEELTSITLVQCKKSLDLLQALQLVCLWYRSPRNATQIPLFQLITITSDMVVDLGFGGLDYPPALTIQGAAEEGLLNSVDAHRRWLVSFVITETAALLKRRANGQKWSSHHDLCLHELELSGQSLESDALLAQHVRVTRMLALICDNMELNVTSTSPVLGTPSCQEIMQNLQAQIMTWRLQVPYEIWPSSLAFTGFFAEVLLYEVVLQTPTNKATFAAPFMVERLSTIDVPSPISTQDHINSVHCLKTACHNLLDTAASFTESELITLPTSVYAPRIAHTVVALLKLHIAITAPGNTYGQTLSPENVQTEAYINKCLDIVNRGSRIDAEAVMVRIVKYVQKLKDWLQEYEASRLHPEKLGGDDLECHYTVHDGSGWTIRKKEFSDAKIPDNPAQNRGELGGQAAVDADAPFMDFFNTEFAIGDIELFDLFSEPGKSLEL